MNQLRKRADYEDCFQYGSDYWPSQNWPSLHTESFGVGGCDSPDGHKELLGKIGVESEQIDKALNEFIHVRDFDPMDQAIENAVSDLDEGERQVLSLASSIGGDVLVLMDDRAGRQIASRLNISVSGVVGLLLLAKEKGVLEKIAHHLEGLRAEGYWLSDEVIKVARKIAGEI